MSIKITIELDLDLGDEVTAGVVDSVSEVLRSGVVSHGRYARSAGYRGADDLGMPGYMVDRDGTIKSYDRETVLGRWAREPQEITALTITAEQLQVLADESHADDDEILASLCFVALGDNPLSTPRGTAEALAMQMDARVKCAEILNARAQFHAASAALAASVRRLDASILESAK